MCSKAQYLKLSSAELCYEVQGIGPYLICVPGASGDASLFKPFRSLVDKHFTVVLYDRRGYSRSKLTEPQDFVYQLETDVEDIRLLMAHLAQDKFYILGSSSGALVSLEYMSRHPDTVYKCVAHEPPLLCVCPNKDELITLQHHMFQLYKEKGKEAAMEVFINDVIGGPDKKDAKMMLQSQASQDETTGKNSTYWLDNEFLRYPCHEFNIEKIKYAYDQGKLILVSGIENKGTSFIYKPNQFLAERLGTKVVDMPGAHLGFISDSKEFAESFINLLK